jgi:hypothetical protein
LLDVSAKQLAHVDWLIPNIRNQFSVSRGLVAMVIDNNNQYGRRVFAIILTSLYIL